MQPQRNKVKTKIKIRAIFNVRCFIYNYNDYWIVIIRNFIN